MTRFARAGIGPGQSFDVSTLSTEQRLAVEQGMADAWNAFARFKREAIDTGRKSSADGFGTGGGITLYVQHESPGSNKEPHWLPAPGGPFFMVLREYWPKPEALDGSWKVPKIVRATR